MELLLHEIIFLKIDREVDIDTHTHTHRWFNSPYIMNKNMFSGFLLPLLYVSNPHFTCVSSFTWMMTWTVRDWSLTSMHTLMNRLRQWVSTPVEPCFSRPASWATTSTCSGWWPIPAAPPWGQCTTCTPCTEGTQRPRSLTWPSPLTAGGWLWAHIVERRTYFLSHLMEVWIIYILN